jgi:hypothetical protein
MITPNDFRQRFREFADPQINTDSAIEFWAGIGASMLPAGRWGSMHDYGVSLFVAHHLAIAQREERSAEVGGPIGNVVGPQTSKSVDKVSASYDTAAVALSDAGFWNMTTYGIRLIQQARMVGAGGVQL